MVKRILTVCSFLTLLTSAVFARPIILSIGSGANWFETGNSELTISSFETDLLQSRQVNTQAIYWGGVETPLFSDKLSKQPYLNAFNIALNVYTATSSITGNVLQAGLSSMDNYQFQAPFETTRLMLDIKPQLFTYRIFSPYLLGGVGVGWNSLSYSESVSPSAVQNSRIILTKNNFEKIAWDAGAGLRIDLTEQFKLNVAYLYTYLGDFETNTQLKYYATNAPGAPIHYTLNSQAFLAGVSWII